ncbi:hypothetical protein [Actinomadura sp. 9N215]|uniref:hypothetical protein n=1 Tax=Actinomadura sp. 9N215 TaxID=3375150 RepID=UPI0037A3C666
MSTLAATLHSTCVSEWHMKVRGLKPIKENKPPRAHRRRIDYYNALCRCLDAWRRGTDFSGEDARLAVVEAAGASSSSTLYNLMGKKKQTHPSLLAVVSGTEMEGFLPTEGYSLGCLIAETKVWSHWPHREGWLNGLAAISPDDRHQAATTLIGTLVVWAAENPRLASAGAFAAPLSAVEDLCVIVNGQVPHAAAASLLARAVELAAGPLGTEPDMVLDTLYDDLMNLGFERHWYVDDLLARVQSGVKDLSHLADRMDDEVRGKVTGRLEPMLLELKRLTDRERGA